MKKLAKFWLVFMLMALLLTGCVDYESKISIDSVGAGTLSNSFFASEELFKLLNNGVDQASIETKQIDGVTYYGITDTIKFSNMSMLNRAIASSDSSTLVHDFNARYETVDNKLFAVISFSVSNIADFRKNIEPYIMDTGIVNSITDDDIQNKIKLVMEFSFPDEIESLEGDTNSYTKTGNSVKFNISPKAETQKFSVRAVINKNIKSENTGEKFNRDRVYNGFSDVTEDAWYYDSLVMDYEAGLISGVGNNKFNPSGKVTIAEAIVMASRVNSIFNDNNYNFDVADGEYWYTPYVKYAISNGIIWEADYSGKYNTAATRKDIAYIFANALPENTYKVIHSDINIPDVSIYSDEYTYISKLYKSGIINGIDSTGKFSGGSDITRAELAVILSRVAFSSTR